jgi:SAM-dependent methyltransferase
VEPIDERTIKDFGQQWTNYRENSGFYASTELFEDAFGAVLPGSEIAGKRVADIGSGTGRIVNMLLALGAAHVIAVEPSDAFDVLKENTANDASRVTLLRKTGDQLPAEPPVDLVVSYGVLHHIENPRPVVDAAFAALVPGGKLAVWLYGYEGNAAYLRLALPMRKLTTHLPHKALEMMSELLNVGMDAYLPLAKRYPVPLAGYMNNVIANLTREHRRLVIYDQLCPAYARYYKEAEARALLERSGFVDVKLHHRHGYSWTVIGTKPR